MLGPLGIGHQKPIPLQPRQPGGQGRRLVGLKLRQADPPDRARRNAPAALGFDPGGQEAGGVAEAGVRGEGGAVHRFAVKQVDPLHRGAPTLHEGGHQQGGVKRTELLVDHLHLQRTMAPQGGVPAADHQPAGHPSLSEGRLEGPADLPHPHRRRRGAHGPGVGQQKQQGGGVQQTRQQGGVIPAQQQRAAVHRLGAGGIVIDHDDLQRWPLNRHGTIVP